MKGMQPVLYTNLRWLVMKKGTTLVWLKMWARECAAAGCC